MNEKNKNFIVKEINFYWNTNPKIIEPVYGHI